MDQSTFDLARARRETPGCAKVRHFNNAGAALMPQPVLDAVVGHLQLEAAIGGYEAKKRETERVERVYEAAASLINCTPYEGVERCGIVTFNVEGIAAAEVQNRLGELSINVSVAQEESSRLDLAGRGLPELVRASVHYYNSEDEIERFCDAVARM